MASIVVAKLHPPPLAIIGRQTLFGTVQAPTLSVPRTIQGHLAITAKATSDSSESLSSPSVVKSVKNIAIDRLPLIPGVFEFVGILFSSWFVYRYLLFKPDRKELFQAINKSISAILDQ